MEAEDLILDDGGKREVIEEVGQVLPHVRVAVLSEALVVEAVNLGDLPTLVVTSEDCDPVPIAHFEADEQSDGLHGVVASVHVVSHEQIVRVWGVASDLEQFHQVVELSMNITAHSDRASDRLDVALRLDNLFRLQKRKDEY